MYGRKPKLGSGLAKLPRQKLRAVSYRHRPMSNRSRDAGPYQATRARCPAKGEPGRIFSSGDRFGAGRGGRRRGTRSPVRSQTLPYLETHHFRPAGNSRANLPFPRARRTAFRHGGPRFKHSWSKARSDSFSQREAKRPDMVGNKWSCAPWGRPAPTPPLATAISRASSVSLPPPAPPTSGSPRAPARHSAGPVRRRCCRSRWRWPRRG